MICKTMTYVDYNGEERTEDFYFNLTKAEIMQLELCAEGGLEATIEEITNERDGKRLVKLWKDIIGLAYGKKSPDGRRFMKSPEITAEFEQTEAYSDLFMMFCTDAKAAAEFVNSLVPNNLGMEIKKAPLDK